MTDHTLSVVPPTGPRQEADLVLRELRDALASHGIVFPSLAVDLVSLTTFSGIELGPLLELGRVNLATARKLTAVLRAGQAPD